MAAILEQPFIKSSDEPDFLKFIFYFFILHLCGAFIQKHAAIHYDKCTFCSLFHTSLHYCSFTITSNTSYLTNEAVEKLVFDTSIKCMDIIMCLRGTNDIQFEFD